MFHIASESQLDKAPSHKKSENEAGKNTTPSGLNCQQSSCRSARSAEREGRVKASNMLKVSFKGKEVFGPKILLVMQGVAIPFQDLPLM